MHDTTLDHLFAKYNYGVVETDCPFLDIYLHTKDPVCTPVVAVSYTHLSKPSSLLDAEKQYAPIAYTGMPSIFCGTVRQPLVP